MIYGDDTFRVQEKVKQMKDAFTQKFDPSGMNTASFPAEGSKKHEPGEILQAACSYPFLGEKRMVLVRDLISETNKDKQDIWLEGFKRAPESTIIVLYETASPKKLERKSLFKELNKLAESHTYPFPELQGYALTKWVQDRIAASGGSADRVVPQLLVERVGADLWQMSHEIEKLIAYASGQVVTKEMVTLLVQASFEGQVFELMDAISKKQTGAVIKLLREERLSGANDHYLLTMLGRQVRILLGARALLDENPSATKQDVADAVGVHPYVAQKALQQARGFSFQQLRDAHGLLFKYDWGLKTGRIHAELAVDLVADTLIQ